MRARAASCRLGSLRTQPPESDPALKVPSLHRSRDDFLDPPGSQVCSQRDQNRSRNQCHASGRSAVIACRRRAIVRLPAHRTEGRSGVLYATRQTRLSVSADPPHSVGSRTDCSHILGHIPQRVRELWRVQATFFGRSLAADSRKPPEERMKSRGSSMPPCNLRTCCHHWRARRGSRDRADVLYAYWDLPAKTDTQHC